jgi:hypothetical protein
MRRLSIVKRLPAMVSCSLIAASFVFGVGQGATPNGSPQGDTWASIGKLPDWSGSWALSRAGHEFASREAHSVSPSGAVGIMPFTASAAKMLLEAQRTDKQVNLAQCLPAGVPGVMLHTILLEWLFTPGRVTMVTENGEIRRIHTDGRAHLPFDQLEGSYEGDSTGHWEGGTLVVDTVNFPNGTLLKDGYLMATRNTHYVERISLKDPGHLQIESVLSDPAIFTKPYAMTRIYERQANTDLIEPQCAQTQRDNGITLDLTPPAG